MQQLPPNWALELEHTRTDEAATWAQRVLTAPGPAARTEMLAQVPAEHRRPTLLMLVSTYRVRILALRQRRLWDGDSEDVLAPMPEQVQPLMRQLIEQGRKRRQARSASAASTSAARS